RAPARGSGGARTRERHSGSEIVQDTGGPSGLPSSPTSEPLDALREGDRRGRAARKWAQAMSATVEAASVRSTMLAMGAAAGRSVAGAATVGARVDPHAGRARHHGLLAVPERTRAGARLGPAGLARAATCARPRGGVARS